MALAGVSGLICARELLGGRPCQLAWALLVPPRGWCGAAGRIPQDGDWATLTPLCPLPPCQACQTDIRVHVAFFFLVCPSCWCWGLGRVSLPWGSSSSPDWWSRGQQTFEAEKALWPPLAENNYTWQLIWACASCKGAQGQAQVNLDLTGVQPGWSGARPYYSRSSVEMPLEGQTTTNSKCRYRCLLRVRILLSPSLQKQKTFLFVLDRSFLKCHFHTFPNPSFETYNFSLFSIYAFYILFFSNSHVTFYHTIYLHFCLFVGYFHKLEYKLHECLVKWYISHIQNRPCI